MAAGWVILHDDFSQILPVSYLLTPQSTDTPGAVGLQRTA